MSLSVGKVTSPKRLGIQGGSNGGLLVGNMVTLYPDLFQAAVCQVPLLDMQRYHKLLAGASWMAEYGNPDIPAEREYIAPSAVSRRLSDLEDLLQTQLLQRSNRTHARHACA